MTCGGMRDSDKKLYGNGTDANLHFNGYCGFYNHRDHETTCFSGKTSLKDNDQKITCFKKL